MDAERSAAGYDWVERRKGSKIRMAVDTSDHLSALYATSANVDDRGEVELFARAVQAVTSDRVDIAYVGQGHVALGLPTPRRPRRHA